MWGWLWQYGLIANRILTQKYLIEDTVGRYFIEKVSPQLKQLYYLPEHIHEGRAPCDEDQFNNLPVSALE